MHESISCDAERVESTLVHSEKSLGECVEYTIHTRLNTYRRRYTYAVESSLARNTTHETNTFSYLQISTSVSRMNFSCLLRRGGERCVRIWVPESRDRVFIIYFRFLHAKRLPLFFRNTEWPNVERRKEIGG